MNLLDKVTLLAVVSHAARGREQDRREGVAPGEPDYIQRAANCMNGVFSDLMKFFGGLAAVFVILVIISSLLSPFLERHDKALFSDGFDEGYAFCNGAPIDDDQFSMSLSMALYLEAPGGPLEPRMDFDSPDYHDKTSNAYRYGIRNGCQAALGMYYSTSF